MIAYWKVPALKWLLATRVSTALFNACSRMMTSPVKVTARLRVVGMPSACIASLMMYSRSIGPSGARPSPEREYSVRPEPFSCTSYLSPLCICSPSSNALPSPSMVNWPNWWPAYAIASGVSPMMSLPTSASAPFPELSAFLSSPRLSARRSLNSRTSGLPDFSGSVSV